MFNYNTGVDVPFVEPASVERNYFIGSDKSGTFEKPWTHSATPYIQPSLSCAPRTEVMSRARKLPCYE